jgi:hypothetical protein
MLPRLQRRIRKGYFKKGERLSWAPFPSHGLLIDSTASAAPIPEILIRINRYFGGETVAIDLARSEGLIADDIEGEVCDLFEPKGYYYGQVSFSDSWLTQILEQGRLIVFISDTVSDRAMKFAYQNLVSESIFVMSESSLSKFPYRCLSDLLFFVTNHEAPVIIEDLLLEYFPNSSPKTKCSIQDCHAELSFAQFKEACAKGRVLHQDEKLFRIN